MSSDSVVIKAVFANGDDLRRFTVPRSIGWTEFAARIASLFNVQPDQVIVQYRDDEDDQVSVASDLELRELFNGPSPIRIAVSVRARSAPAIAPKPATVSYPVVEPIVEPAPVPVPSTPEVPVAASSEASSAPPGSASSAATPSDEQPKVEVPEFDQIMAGFETLLKATQEIFEQNPQIIEQGTKLAEQFTARLQADFAEAAAAAAAQKEEEERQKQQQSSDQPRTRTVHTPFGSFEVPLDAANSHPPFGFPPFFAGGRHHPHHPHHPRRPEGFPGCVPPPFAAAFGGDGASPFGAGSFGGPWGGARRPGCHGGRSHCGRYQQQQAEQAASSSSASQQSQSQSQSQQQQQEEPSVNPGFWYDEDEKLRQLAEMGLFDVDLNRQLLRKHKGNVHRVIAELF